MISAGFKIKTQTTAREAGCKLGLLASPDVAATSARFFKTGAGQYGEGDVFIGIRVPVLRQVSHEFGTMSLDEIRILLNSPIHEHRLLALLILVQQVAGRDDEQKKAVFDFYLSNTTFINNWDLVDCSAPPIVGGYLLNKPVKPLIELAKSASLWERRIAIVSTLHFIRHAELAETLTISKKLLYDHEDLIHKAAGWMLREVGKKNRSVLEGFLDTHGAVMPRTMLRYAIEHFPPEQRKAYLAR